MKAISLILASLLLLTACGQSSSSSQVSKDSTPTAEKTGSAPSEQTTKTKNEPTKTSQPQENQTASSAEEQPQSEDQDQATETSNQDNNRSAIDQEDSQGDPEEGLSKADASVSPQPTGEDLYARTLELVAADTSIGRATHYAFYDVDGNGTPELITAQINNGSVFPAAIYYLQNGVSTYLAHAEVAGGGGGRRDFTLYTDGTIEWDDWSSGTGRGTAYLYQLAADNSGYWVVGQAEFNLREQANPAHVTQFDGGRVPLDPYSFNWQALSR